MGRLNRSVAYAEAGAPNQMTFKQSARRQFRVGSAATCAIAFCLHAGAFAQETPIEADGEGQAIIVTGTKRGDSLQDTVQSVTVIRPDDAIGFLQTFDAFTRVPNVTITRDGILPSVRGLDGNGTAQGGGGAVTGSNPRFTSYIDGVARTYSAVPDGFGGLWDISQIEILRGSQSTTFGQNSLAGALVQVTNDPKFTNEAAVQAGIRSEGTTVNGAAMLNVALTDNLAVRVTGQEVRGSSFVDFSTSGGTGLTAADREQLSDERFSNYRAKVLYAPTERTSLLFTANLERSRRAFPNDKVSLADASLAVNEPVTFVANENTALSLALTHEFSPSWTFEAVVSRQVSLSEFTPPSVGIPDPAEYLDFTFDVEQWAFEPKLIYRDQNTRTRFIAGAYVLDRQRTDFGAPGSAFALEADDEVGSISVFADATIEISRSFDLLLGGRYIEDSQTRVFSGFGGFFGFDFDRTESLFLPKLGATLHVSEDASLSLTGYRGYTAGGGGVSFVTLTPYSYDREISDTVELAARTAWLDGRLIINANAFYSELKDQQKFATGPAGPNDSIILNLARSKSAGLEFDVSYALAGTGRIGAAVGLLETEITEFGSVANDIFNGNDFAQAPGMTGNVYGNVEVTDGLMLGGNIEYSAARFSAFDNLAEDRLGSFVLANLNARYRIGSITVEGYVNNLFDRVVDSQRATDFGERNIRRPRTFGVNVTAGF